MDRSPGASKHLIKYTSLAVGVVTAALGICAAFAWVSGLDFVMGFAVLISLSAASTTGLMFTRATGRAMTVAERYGITLILTSTMSLVLAGLVRGLFWSETSALSDTLRAWGQPSNATAELVVLGTALGSVLLLGTTLHTALRHGEREALAEVAPGA